MSLARTNTRPDTNSFVKKTIPQTLFLGASVSNFTTNLGWGAQASSLSINMVNDTSGCAPLTQISMTGQAGSNFNDENHYYDTEDGDSLYVGRDPSTGRGILYGKIHHRWSTDKKQFVSIYHRDKDPGFLGLKNTWGGENPGYDITGTPVYFRSGDFEYCGLVKNWDHTVGTGGGTTSVTIESPASLLANSYVIVGEYAGSIFSRSTSTASIGAPRNYVGSAVDYTPDVGKGTIHNLFNAFGFLESFSFGYSDSNDQGMPISYIINALQVLTSEKDKASKGAYSPFGRIIGRAAMTSDQAFCGSSFYTGHGLFPSVAGSNGEYYHEYILDLSELPRPNNMLRMAGPVISILDLVSEVCEITSRDFFVELMPAADENGNVLPTIKIRTVNRYSQPIPNQVRNVVNSISNTYALSNVTYGQESGEALNRTMLIGGPQQRLYQAKNYRLAYTQCNYVLDPSANKVVNFYSYNQSKYRTPSFASTRLALNSNAVASDYSWLIADDELVKENVDNLRTTSTSTEFLDTTNGPGVGGLIGGGGNKVGNYREDKSYNPIPAGTFAPTLGGSPATNFQARWIPLFEDIIAPFYGFEFEDQSADTSGLPEESLKRPRKVFLDSFTGQQVVVFDIGELPPLRYGISTLYSGTKFVVTETEMRAALAGFDNLILYYASKTYKPDLILMLQKTYIDNRLSVVSSNEGPMAMGAWGMVEDENAADTEGYPTNVFADQDEEVNVTNLLLSKSFTEDLMSIHAFISDIASKYYGKSYTVKLPGIRGYRDWSSGGNQQVGEDSQGRPIYVWAGSPKVYYDYQVASDGAWEEPGNYIDDNIIVGSVDSYHLMDETGKILPVLGYNASDNFDHTAYKMCADSTLTQAAYRSRKESPVFGIELYSMQAVEFQDCDTAKFYYPSVDLSGVSQDVLLVDNKDTIKNPYGIGSNIAPGYGRKAYVKSAVRNDLYFKDASTFFDPKVIIDSPGIFLNSSSLEYTQDPNRTVVSNAALEDLLIYMYSTPANLQILDVIRVWSSRLSHMYNGYLLRTKHKKSESAQMVELAPKAAQPFFAAVPIKSNKFVYGPWTDYPHQYKNIIFPGATNQDNMVRNLLNGIRVEVDPEMVPWNYGGSSLLDKAAMLKIYQGQTYQNVIESGSFEIPGLPVFGLGGRFSAPYATKNYSNQYFILQTDYYEYTDADGNTTQYNFNYLQDQNFNDTNPVLSNLQINVSESKISTSYSLKVYSKPLSRFNKEAADRLKKIAKQNLALSQRNSTATKKLIGEQIKALQSSIGKRESGASGWSSEGASKKLMGWSPVRLIIGSAEYHSSPPTKIAARTTRTNIRNSQNSATPGTGTTGQANNTNVTTKTYEGSRGDWDINASFNGNNSNVPWDQANGPINTMLKDLRHYATINIHQLKERGLDEKDNYGDKAIMSLDGLLSPVSFYPTRYNSCYSIAKWPRSKCPVCCGSKTMTENIKNYSSNTEVSVTKVCEYCYDDANTKAKNTLPKKRNSNLALPPYVTVRNTSDTNILGINADQYNLNKVSDATINVFSLQPVLQSTGDFANPNAQATDKKRHSISAVGRGGVHHGETIGGVTDLIIKNNIENNYYGVNPDFYGETDIRLQQYLQSCGDAASSIAGNCGYLQYPLNNRFIGLRGPIMVHGWGYDTDGYPVPNAAEEPKFVNDKGMFKRHKKKKSTYADGTDILDADGNNVYEDDYDHPGDYPGGSIAANDLGSVISKSQYWVNNKWTRPVRSDKFYLNWGERPDLWPVGPIDLRWDKERKVWVTPQPKIYKNVYITLEEDLVTVQNPEDTLKPCRGFITDLEYDTTSDTSRKLVFVVDKSGYTAPRGAKLLCMYNADSGFYEVLSKPTFTAFGTIQADGSSAVLVLTYMQSRNRNIDANTVSVNFSNPFGFSVSSDQKGLFMYMDSSWNLIATH
jgi:hypothetical protein